MIQFKLSVRGTGAEVTRADEIIVFARQYFENKPVGSFARNILAGRVGDLDFYRPFLGDRNEYCVYGTNAGQFALFTMEEFCEVFLA